jgi:hypothetical protein
MMSLTLAHSAALATKGARSMAMTEQEILAELRKQGVTSLDDLAAKAAANVSANTAAAVGATPELYIYSGKNYDFIHSD